MKVSIITVCFNSESFILDTIRSVNSQSYSNIEHIFIDGCSQDQTVEIIRSNAMRDIQILSEPDLGIYDAMNKGLSLATGDIIGILNSDDVFYDNNTVSKVIDKFNAEHVDSVYGDLVYVRQDNIFSVLRFWKSSSFKKNSFKKGWHPPHPSFFVKHNIYKKYGNFDTSINISADFELMLRFLEKRKISSSYLPIIIVRMRIGGKSNKTVRNIIAGNKEILRAFDKNKISLNKVLFLFYRFTPKLLQVIRGNKHL